MSIELHWIEGLACPFFICVVCKKRITDQPMAMCAWGEPLKDLGKANISPSHVHKGACLETFEEQLPKGEHLMTVELRDHIKFLADNSNFDRRKK